MACSKLFWAFKFQSQIAVIKAFKACFGWTDLAFQKLVGFSKILVIEVPKLSLI